MEKAAMMQTAEEMVESFVDLPTIPHVATRVIELLDRPGVELDEVADMILADQVLAARVIKMVNSPLYKPANEIKSVKRALIYLGFRHIRELAFTCSFVDVFEGRDGIFDVRSFWEHSFGVGVVAKIIAQRVRYPDTEKAYLVGIVHDIGEVFLSYYRQDAFRALLESVKGQPFRLVEKEAEYLGTSHSEIGLCIAKKWNFPADYCEVIGLHHDPDQAVLDPTLCAIVNLADLFCSVRQLDYGGSSWVTFNLAEEKAWAILKSYAPNLADLDVERFCYELDDRVPEIQDMVKSIFQGIGAKEPS
ncbi:HDOD domain-containing protein [Geomonas paludis]|uniref:HD family phosphohydrolase n=1 Tax=Geomonas paludis TaxID=2740185 RepID=A0A6V8MQC6_9BACT|nr:HDOD domain-containing protein [Geomonas paludis]UPU36252.1 HDOD domain-containing protein [Geomonas paludis]GFO62132.1 HD family phosphohydrolase [Geomonas paludis]